VHEILWRGAHSVLSQVGRALPQFSSSFVLTPVCWSVPDRGRLSEGGVQPLSSTFVTVCSKYVERGYGAQPFGASRLGD
jgi:hypothetical protein